MMTFQSYILLLLIQVTAISVVAIAMNRVARTSAVSRHTIALTALTLILLSPLLTWLLPLRWYALMPAADDLKPTVAATVTDVRTPTGHERSSAVDDSSRAESLQVPPRSTRSTESKSLLNRSDPESPGVSSSTQLSETIEFSATSAIGSQPGGMAVDEQSNVDATESQSEIRDSQSKQWIRWGLACSLCIWFSGAIVCATRLLSRRRQFYSAVKPLCPLSTEALSASTEECLRTTLGIRDLPKIRTSRMAPSPVVLGVLRPVVLLPETLSSELSERDLTSVLIHECAHIARGDHWIHVLQQIAGIVWWFHPGVRMVNRVLARSREEVCDNYVLRHSNPADFARTLLELTERCGPARPALSLLGLFGRQWSLETRVTELLNPRRNMLLKTERRWITVIVSVMCTCCLIVGGVSAVQVDEPAQQSAAQVKTHPPDDQTSQADESPPAAEPQPLTPQDDVSKLTLSGVCHLSESDEPVSASVRVYHLGDYPDVPKLLGEIRTDEQGQFVFRDLEVPDADPGNGRSRSILVIATAPGYSSATARPEVYPSDKLVDEVSLSLSDAPTTLSGVITDVNGIPVKGATVFLPNGSNHAIAGYHSAITDESGRYEISDVKAWKSADTKTFDEKTGIGEQVSACFFFVQHPDFPHSRAKYSALPQVVDITLQPPAIIEGQVRDLVTGAPVPDVAVQAQGVARGGWYEVQTDKAGRYALRMSRDHYNIWAVQEDRMPLAIKALKAEPGVHSIGHDIHMVRGGFVKGRVLTASGEPAPIPQDYANQVAHYGPARPRTGAAVTSTVIDADGTYQLHVAPGRNYIYVMGGQSAAFVEVGEGQEVELDLVVGVGTGREFSKRDADRTLRAQLFHAAMLEDQEAELAEKQKRRSTRREDDPNASMPDSVPETVPNQSRIRRDSPTGRLLTKLEDMNRSPLLFKEPWAELLREIIDLGPEAVPELIAELDATNDDRMLRCLGFSLRAIGDKRAIPALIRAIPKTLRPGTSDLGLRIENDETLKQFMQKHDLDDRDSGNRYGFGRVIREIFGALEVLSGQEFNEQELYSVSRIGFPSQILAKETLFHRNATVWRDWWEQTGSAAVDDPEYKNVHLAPLSETKSSISPYDGMLKTFQTGSGRVLTSIREPQLRPGQVYDLDTGRYANLPEQLQRESPSADDVAAILRWAADEGFDIMGDEYSDSDGKAIYAIRTIGLQAWQLDDTRWKSLPAKFTVEELKAEGRQVAGDWLLSRDPDSGSVDPQEHAPFLFVTREGTPGVIYVGIPVIDDSLKPGGRFDGDVELKPVAYRKGRRFGFASLVPNKETR